MMVDLLWTAREWLIKHKWQIAIGVVAFAAGAYAFAGPVSEFTSDGEKVTLFDDDCSSKNGNLAIFTDREKVQYKGCWKLGSDHFVYILYEDGDMGRISRTRFRAISAL